MKASETKYSILHFQFSISRKYHGWTPYHYCKNNPVNRLDPSGYADYITETATFSDGIQDNLKFVVSNNAVSQNSIYPDNGAAGPPILNYESLKATGTFAGTSKTWEKTTTDVVDNIGKANEGREDAAAVGITNDNKGVYSYGGQGIIESGHTNSSVASEKAINGVISQKAISSSITLIHSHGVGLELDPSNPKDYNAISQFKIQSGIVINSKKDVNIFGSTPGEKMTIPFKRFDDFMKSKK